MGFSTKIVIGLTLATFAVGLVLALALILSGSTIEIKELNLFNFTN